MISIIVCHRNEVLLNQFKKNISNTIGVAYELVVIDNTTNKYNIFQAYNLGVKQSQYDIFCFAHEDLTFHTKDWGKKVIEHFKNPKVGVIGVCGSHYQARLPAAWWSSNITSSNNLSTTNGITRFESWRYYDNQYTSMEGIIVDGLWFCIPKMVMQQVRFDDVTFHGFHCYDSDICLQIKDLNFEVRIVFDVLIEHFYSGSEGRIWIKSIFCLFKKWEKKLPISNIELSKQEIVKANFHNFKELIEKIEINKMELKYRMKVCYFYLRYNSPLSEMKWILIPFMFNFVLRKKIVINYPEIRYDNSLLNSVKYILKKKFKA